MAIAKEDTGGFMSFPPTDELWQLAWSDARQTNYTIVREGPRCTNPRGEFCAIGDGRLELAAKDSAEFVRGYYFTFEFGDTTREDGVDAGIFRDLLRSFTFK